MQDGLGLLRGCAVTKWASSFELHGLIDTTNYDYAVAQTTMVVHQCHFALRQQQRANLVINEVITWDGQHRGLVRCTGNAAESAVVFKG